MIGVAHENAERDRKRIAVLEELIVAADKYLGVMQLGMPPASAAREAIRELRLKIAFHLF